MAIKYTVLKDKSPIAENLSEEEFFNLMEDLAQEFYNSDGSQNPSYEIVREIVE